MVNGKLNALLRPDREQREVSCYIVIVVGKENQISVTVDDEKWDLSLKIIDMIILYNLCVSVWWGEDEWPSITSVRCIESAAYNKQISQRRRKSSDGWLLGLAATSLVDGWMDGCVKTASHRAVVLRRIMATKCGLCGHRISIPPVMNIQWFRGRPLNGRLLPNRFLNNNARRKIATDRKLEGGAAHKKNRDTTMLVD